MQPHPALIRPTKVFGLNKYQKTDFTILLVQLLLFIKNQFLFF